MKHAIALAAYLRPSDEAKSKLKVTVTTDSSLIYGSPTAGWYAGLKGTAAYLRRPDRAPGFNKTVYGHNNT